MNAILSESPSDVADRPNEVDPGQRGDASGPRRKPDPLTLAAQAARYRECYTQAHLASQRATQCESELTERNEEERSATHHRRLWAHMLIGSMVDLMPGIPSIARWCQREIPLVSFDAGGVTFALVADADAEAPDTYRELIERTHVLMLGERPPVADEQPPAPYAGSPREDLPAATPKPPALPVDDYLRECCGAALRFFAAVRPRWEKGRDWINTDVAGDHDNAPPGRRSAYETWDFLERLYGLAEKAAAYACLATDPAMPNPRDWLREFSVEGLLARTVQFEGRHFIGGGLIEGTDRSKRLACIMTDADPRDPTTPPPETIESPTLAPDPPPAPPPAVEGEDADGPGVPLDLCEVARQDLHDAVDTFERAQGLMEDVWRREYTEDKPRLLGRLQTAAMGAEQALAFALEHHLDALDDDAHHGCVSRPYGITVGRVAYVVCGMPGDGMTDPGGLVARIELDRLVAADDVAA